jgi:hypothetical protein
LAWLLDGRIWALSTMNRSNSGRRCLYLAEWRFAVAQRDRNHLT